MDSNPFDSSLVLSFADAVTTGKKGKQHKPRAAGKHTGDQAQINVLEPRILLANVISAVDPGIGGTTPFTRPGFIGINIANNLISPGTVTIQDDDAQIGPFITWNTDFDTGGFVTQAVMDVLEAAGNTITSGLMDTLDAIAPSGINTWTASFTPRARASISRSSICRLRKMSTSFTSVGATWAGRFRRASQGHSRRCPATRRRFSIP